LVSAGAGCSETGFSVTKLILEKWIEGYSVGISAGSAIGYPGPVTGTGLKRCGVASTGVFEGGGKTGTISGVFTISIKSGVDVEMGGVLTSLTFWGAAVPGITVIVPDSASIIWS